MVRHWWVLWTQVSQGTGELALERSRSWQLKFCSANVFFLGLQYKDIYKQIMRQDPMKKCFLWAGSGRTTARWGAGWRLSGSRLADLGDIRFSTISGVGQLECRPEVIFPGCELAGQRLVYWETGSELRGPTLNVPLRQVYQGIITHLPMIDWYFKMLCAAH